MKYFSSSYLLTTSLVLLYTTTSTLARAVFTGSTLAKVVFTGSTLAKVVFTGKNTGIEKANDSTSELDASSSLLSTYQYHNDPALVKIIKEATEKPTYDDPVGNSDVALHNRSKRAADEREEVNLTLPNGSCVSVRKGPVYTPPHWLFSPERTNLYAKCLVDEPCQDQKFTSSEEGELITWGDSLRELRVVSSTEP
ncbi:MAG: hypothetical protein LN561_05425 [Rickettsia endosymbiont of Labidopullus appendiculatus]|nr:hypothetical protein [Rickettsia endosymbiont of Labidopullus appendiculatus]